MICIASVSILNIPPMPQTEICMHVNTITGTLNGKLLSYNYGPIYVRCYHGQHNLRAFIVKWHSRQMPSMMI